MKTLKYIRMKLKTDVNKKYQKVLEMKKVKVPKVYIYLKKLKNT